MDQYKASIESVDNALNRLNQTLASYKLILSEHKKPSNTTRKPQQHAEASRAAAAPATAPTNPCVATGQSKSTDVRPQRPVANLSPMDSLVRSLRSTNQYPEPSVSNSFRLRRLQETLTRVASEAYCLPLYLVQAVDFLGLGYPDLAVGATYKALLLSDALENDAEEYHEEASDALKGIIQLQPLEERISIIRRAMDAELENASPTELDPTLDVELVLWLKGHYLLILYRILTRSLLLCSCLRSALAYTKQALRTYTQDAELISIHQAILRAGTRLCLPLDANSPLDDWPNTGSVRRELYPWNSHEADRLNKLVDLNTHMSNASRKLEVRAVELPLLNSDAAGGTSTQLGVFATCDIAPGEELLHETSILTANNKLQDALCDACSADLPELHSPEGASVVSCPECEVVFCSQWCYDEAVASYHPALCDKDVEAIAKDVPPTEAADSLYSLLLLRALSMAETQGKHPLDLYEIKYLWGDFTPLPSIDEPVFTSLDDPDSCRVSRALPWNFEHNVRLPFHMLEKMDIDIFQNQQYDVWVFNTLYAKFRGVASARLSGLGGRAIRGPEVSAVHPMWCLANHSCDPNVSWKWGGSISFWARKERIPWAHGSGPRVVKSQAGIRKDEEILNHYCDIDLTVSDRRAWARGALGGDCKCPRCMFEAGETSEGA